MRNQSTGSYAFGNFSEDHKELKRLQRQAAIASELEGRVLRQVGLDSGMRVLDLACGPGIVTAMLAKAVVEGEVVGVDLSEELLVEARAYAENQQLTNIRFEQGDVYAFDESLGQFDFIYARFLFQHLSDPEKALTQILPRLAPGGRLCVVDIDDQWLTLHPEPDGFRSFTGHAAEGQSHYGGDRNVGRKLGYLLQKTGLKDVDVNVITVTSQQLGIRDFLDITTGFKKEQVSDQLRDQAMADLAEIYKVVEVDNAWGFVGVFVATGINAINS
jgi:SAM-dependent methyltransferase